MTDILLFDKLPEYLRDQITAGNSRCVCPKCGGGSSKESSLDVRQEETGVMRLKCWRSTCEWYAITVTDPNAQIQSKTVRPPRPFSDPIMPLDDRMQRILVQAYALNPNQFDKHRWGQSEDGRQLIMPILDRFGRDRGHVTRTFDEPKRCFTFKATAQPWLDHWPTGGDILVIVEDCLSACRLSGIGIDAVALLGTSISVAQAQEIAETANGRPVYLTLDNDAFVKSLKLVDRHKHIVNMQPILLLEDIKAMDSDDEIRELFYGRA